MADRQYLERLTKELNDKGFLIDAGFIGLRLACIPLNAPPDQIKEMRMAFFAGALHLFSSIMTVLEPGEEPTEKDMERLSLIDQELKKFGETFMLRDLPTEGSA